MCSSGSDCGKYKLLHCEKRMFGSFLNVLKSIYLDTDTCICILNIVNIHANIRAVTLNVIWLQTQMSWTRAAPYFNCIYIYSFRQGVYSSDVDAAHLLQCSSLRGVHSMMKIFHLPNIGQTNNSYFQWGSKSSNQWWWFQCIISFSLLKTVWRHLQSECALVIT